MYLCDFRADIKPEAYHLQCILPKIKFWNQTTKPSYLQPFSSYFNLLHSVCEPRRRRWNPEIFIHLDLCSCNIHNDDVDRPSIRDPFCVLRSRRTFARYRDSPFSGGIFKNRLLFAKRDRQRVDVSFVKCKKGNENLTTGARKRQYKCTRRSEADFSA